jgi:hypothetical protein
VPGVLYHPHFEPSLAWLRTSLLVYDNVWSIVPREANYTPSEIIRRHLESFQIHSLLSPPSRWTLSMNTLSCVSSASLSRE